MVSWHHNTAYKQQINAHTSNKQYIKDYVTLNANIVHMPMHSLIPNMSITSLRSISLPRLRSLSLPLLRSLSLPLLGSLRSHGYYLLLLSGSMYWLYWSIVCSDCMAISLATGMGIGLAISSSICIYFLYKYIYKTIDIFIIHKLQQLQICERYLTEQWNILNELLFDHV